jgi:hypothetical protein
MKYCRNRVLLAGATLLLALGAPATSSAQSESAPAQGSANAAAAEHAKRAQVAFDLQDWATATREYEAAYKAEQKPEYLWGLAQTHRMSGKYADAIRSYKAFQRSGASTNQANAAEMMIAKCEAEISKEEAKRAAEAAKAEKKEAAAPVAPAPPPEQPQKASGLPVGWFITGAVVTVALGATATWSGLDTQNKASAYESTPTRAAYLNGKDLELRTNLLLGATGVAAVSTVVIAAFTNWSGKPKKSTEQHAVRLQPRVTTNGGGLVFTGAF